MDTHKEAPLTVIERDPRHGMSPIVFAGLEILRANPSPDTLRELLAVQREYERDEARKAFAVAMVALKHDLPSVIEHDAVVDFTNNAGRQIRYTHPSLAAVLEAVTPALTQHGFSLAWEPSTPKPGEVEVTCRLTHQGGHVREATLRAPPDKSGAKSDPQAIASTITLLERYTVCAVLGIASRAMKEPEGAEEPTPAVVTDTVNSARNLRVVGRLKEHGRTREQAEEFLGRKVPDWTAEDIDRLKAWVAPPAAAEERQPGEEG
jgi:hypothetical protein